MQSEEGEARIDTDAADAQPATRRFRLPPRTMALAAAGFLLLVAFAVGGWAYLAQGERRQAERERAEAQARRQAENDAVANSPENLSQLEAARRAHAEIMAADAPAPAVAAPPAAVVAPEAGSGEAPAGKAAADASRAPVPEPAPALVAPLQPPKAPAPTVVPVREGPTPSVANDPPALGPGGCTLNGGNGAGFGTALGRCLEEFNRIERETRKSAPRQR